jgi:hypothetical protein
MFCFNNNVFGLTLPSPKERVKKRNILKPLCFGEGLG